MATRDTGIRGARPASRLRIPPARLDALIEEAIVDRGASREAERVPDQEEPTGLHACCSDSRFQNAGGARTRIPHLPALIGAIRFP